MKGEKLQKLQKYFYDRFIWLADYRELAAKKAEYFKRDYAAHPEKYRQKRIEQRENHRKHCSTPEYKKWKHEYDKQYRNKRLYGEYWESAIALCQLANIVDNRLAKREQKNITKSQKRKRYANKNTKRKELESCTMGLYQPS